MSFIGKSIVDGGELLLWELNDANEFNSFRRQFEHNEKFTQLKHPKRQYEWLAVLRLLHELGIDSSLLHYTENGKPYLINTPYADISISHSDALVGIYLHKEKIVGLDIEHVDRPFQKVQDKYLVDEELQLIPKLENAYCLFWCIKEAVYKLADQQGMDYKNTIRIKLSSTLEPEVWLSNQLERGLKVDARTIGKQLIVCVSEESPSI